MEANINKLMKGHSWKMSEEEIHDELVKLGYITDNIDFSKMGVKGNVHTDPELLEAEHD